MVDCGCVVGPPQKPHKLQAGEHGGRRPNSVGKRLCAQDPLGLTLGLPAFGCSHVTCMIPFYTANVTISASLSSASCSGKCRT